MGRGARILMLNRALAGHPVTISVIGVRVRVKGVYFNNRSHTTIVSACNGAGDDPVSPVC